MAYDDGLSSRSTVFRIVKDGMIVQCCVLVRKMWLWTDAGSEADVANEDQQARTFGATLV
jgi:hypothetical protein